MMERVRKPATSGAMMSVSGATSRRLQTAVENMANIPKEMPEDQKQKLTKKLIAKIKSMPRKNKRNILRNFWKYRQDEIKGATRAERRRFWREIWEKIANYSTGLYRLPMRSVAPEYSREGEAARRMRAMERVDKNRRRRLENLVLIPHQKEMAELRLEPSEVLMNSFNNTGMTRTYRLVDLK